MLSMNSVTRQFAYDQVRLYNREHNIGLEYTTKQELNQPIPFIPFSMNLEGNGSISKIDMQEQLVQYYIREIDKNPNNLQLWMSYIAIYEDLADNAESKKERVLLSREFHLDGNAANGI